MYFNVSSPARSSFGKRQPVNRLVLGTVYSLHEPSGKLATDNLWYPADYVGPLRPMSLKPFWKRLREFEKLIRKYLPRSQYMEDIEVAIRRYTRTLDSRHWNTAFAKLWNLLEHLTDTSTTGYDKTIRRALFLYHKDERDYNTQASDALSKPGTVHAGYETEDIETFLYQLKRYVERVLLFHIFTTPGFSNLRDTAEFLNLPADLPELQRKIRLMDRALKYHGGP